MRKYINNFNEPFTKYGYKQKNNPIVKKIIIYFHTIRTMYLLDNNK